MKYKLSIKKKSGFKYECKDGILFINDIPIEEPEDKTIVEYDVPEEAKAYGIKRGYRDEEGNAICEIVKFVEDPLIYASGPGLKNGKTHTYSSKWDLKQLLTAEEVVNGNIKQEGSEDDV